MKLRTIQNKKKTNCISVIASAYGEAKFKLERNVSDEMSNFISVFVRRL